MTHNLAFMPLAGGWMSQKNIHRSKNIVLPGVLWSKNRLRWMLVDIPIPFPRARDWKELGIYIGVKTSTHIHQRRENRRFIRQNAWWISCFDIHRSRRCFR